MREIRVRAWDKITKKMYKVSSIHIEDEYVDLFEKTIYEGEFKRKFSEIVLMQYTGLKDKNGVEIYEGYIVKIDVHDRLDWNTIVGEVVFLEGSFIVEDIAGFGITLWSETNEIEVIGNKFDNLELLEG